MNFLLKLLIILFIFKNGIQAVVNTKSLSFLSIQASGKILNENKSFIYFKKRFHIHHNKKVNKNNKYEFEEVNNSTSNNKISKFMPWSGRKKR